MNWIQGIGSIITASDPALGHYAIAVGDCTKSPHAVVGWVQLTPNRSPRYFTFLCECVGSETSQCEISGSFLARFDQTLSSPPRGNTCLVLVGTGVWDHDITLVMSLYPKLLSPQVPNLQEGRTQCTPHHILANCAFIESGYLVTLCS